VWTTNLVGLLLGIGMFSLLILITSEPVAETPHEARNI
jgi:hypothetical protein